VNAMVFCTAAPMLVDSPRFSGNETNSPFEQEEERESAEESSEVYTAGRKLLRWKSDQCTRQGVSAQFALSGNRRRHCFAGCFDGHRLANGLTAPLVL
jgi:hypothetical protein